MSSDDPVSNRDLLVAVGLAVWGERWRRPMALAVGVSHPTLLSVETGERPLSPALRSRLGKWAGRALMAERAEAQRRLALLAQAQRRWDPMEAKKKKE